MSLTTLIGTKWIFNKSINLSVSSGTSYCYEIIGTLNTEKGGLTASSGYGTNYRFFRTSKSGGSTTSDYLAWVKQTSSGGATSTNSFSLAWSDNVNYGYPAINGQNRFSTYGYVTLEITGGGDATNSNFITWLQANATQVIEETEYTLRINGTTTDSYDGHKIKYIHYNGNNYKIKPCYSITTTVQNGTYSGASVIVQDGTASVTIAANDGYQLPSSVTVSGATSSYNSSTGVISISAPTGNVTISAVCSQAQSGYSGTIGGIFHQFYVKVNGTATSSNYDYENSGQEMQITVSAGDYFTVYCDGEECWLSTTYSSNVTGSPTSQTGATLVTVTPTADNFRASLADSF